MRSYETLREQVLKPIRLNPPASLVIAASTLSLINYIQHLGEQEFSYGHGLSSIGLGAGIAAYHTSLNIYRRSRDEIAEHGFREKYAKKFLRPYCDRQGLYVAAVEKGYGFEARNLIRQTPSDHMAFSWIPPM